MAVDTVSTESVLISSGISENLTSGIFIPVAVVAAAVVVAAVVVPGSFSILSLVLLLNTNVAVDFNDFWRVSEKRKELWKRKMNL
jgi:hypothetical protein